MPCVAAIFLPLICAVVNNKAPQHQMEGVVIGYK